MYSIRRFREDDFFQTMNGIGQLLVQCIEAFPKNFDCYKKDKLAAKEKCRAPMRKLKALLQEKRRVRSFINKAMFNGGEVNYLTVRHNDIYHVFLNKEVVSIFANAVIVENSKARSRGQVIEQKVIFKYNGTNLAELEMRNDSSKHYRQIRFNMMKQRMMNLLFDKLSLTNKYSNKVYVYGNAGKKFGNWKK